MKNKLLIFLAALAASAGFSVRVQAQTDVTSTYFTNADCSSSTGWILSKPTVSGKTFNTGLTNGTMEFWASDLGLAQLNAQLNNGTTTTIPDGVYRLTANAYNRTSLAKVTMYLYAATATDEYNVGLKKLTENSIYTIGTGTGGAPNTLAEASAAFAAGDYLNTIDDILVVGGKLSIGVHTLGKLSGDWTAFDNFKLYDLGSVGVSSVLTKLIQEANTSADLNYSGKSTLQAAISVAQTALAGTPTVSDITTLQSAIKTYKLTQEASALSPVNMTYLINNPGFEKGYTTSLVTSNGGYNAPIGWTMTYGETHANNNAMVVGPDVNIIGNGSNVISTPSEGSLQTFIRLRWTNGSNIKCSQTVNALPAGRYKLSVDMKYKDGGTSTTAKFIGKVGETTVMSKSPTSATYATYESDAFDLLSNASLTLVLDVTQNAANEACAFYDNVKLTYYGDPLAAAVAEYDAAKLAAQTAFTNATLDVVKTQLTTAIDLSVDKTSLSELSAAVTQLNAAIAVANKAALFVDKNATAVISNPSFTSNVSSWTTTDVTNSASYSMKSTAAEQYNAAQGGYFDGGNWGGTGWSSTTYQDLPNLPAGTYTLRFAARASAGVTMTLFASVDGGVTKVSSAVPALEAAANTGSLGHGWSWVGLTVDVASGQTLRIGMQASTADIHQWLSMDEFSLYYGTNVVETTADQIVLSGDVDAAKITEIEASVGSKTSLNLTGASAQTDLVISNTNPNLVVYNSANSKLSVENAILVKDGIAEAINLNENYSFKVPVAFTAVSASYVRSFTAASGNNVSGWQSIVVPFNVTAITATKGGNTITLEPFSTWDGTTESTSSHPFWLYKAKADGTGYETASSIEANVPYLISIPNDPSSYADFYNVSGNVTFTGTALAVTSTTVGALPNYSIVPNFDGNKVSVYALNAAGSLWESGKSVNSFYAYATSGNSSAPKFISIFGDGEVTGIKDILSETTMTDKTVSAFAAEGGVTIVSKNPGKVAIYTDGGLLLKVVPVGEGSNFVALASGKYIVNATVVIVK